MIKIQIKFIEVAKEWMHGCVMENIRKIKIKLENIWIDLIRSIYAPYIAPILWHGCHQAPKFPWLSDSHAHWLPNRHAEVLKVLVVCPNLKLACGTFKVVLPLLQCTDDHQHLLVMDFIVPLGRAEAFGEEGNQVPFSAILWQSPLG